MGFLVSLILAIIGFVLSFMINYLELENYINIIPVCWFGDYCKKSVNNLKPYIVVILLFFVSWIITSILPC
jgi:hypothetical protein